MPPWWLACNLPPTLTRSITWDQGTEMARHLATAAKLGAPVYFCDSDSPWQRGTNENTNGLLRDYFPKGVTLINDSPSTCWPSKTKSTTDPAWSSKTVAPLTYSPPC
jgi:IS30 family transposase